MRNVTMVVFLCLGIVIQLQAQDTERASGSDQINLQEAIDIALENNFQLRVANNNLTLSELTEQSERADFFPSLSANFGGRRSTGPGFVPGSATFINQTSNSVNGGINSTIPIFNALKTSIVFAAVSLIHDLRRKTGSGCGRISFLIRPAVFYKWC